MFSRITSGGNDNNSSSAYSNSSDSIFYRDNGYSANSIVCSELVRRRDVGGVGIDSGGVDRKLLELALFVT